MKLPASQTMGTLFYPGKKDLYLVGGYKGSPNGHQASVFKSANGYLWEKLSWELKAAQSELKACITTNAESGHANLVVFGGQGTGNLEEKLKIYDIEDPNPATDGYTEITTKGFGPEDQNNQLVCHDGWVHVASEKKKLHSVKLGSSAEFKTLDYSTHSLGATLMVYQNKAGLVSGMDSRSGMPKYQTKFFYFDTLVEELTEGSEFPWNEDRAIADFVPVVTN